MPLLRSPSRRRWCLAALFLALVPVPALSIGQVVTWPEPVVAADEDWAKRLGAIFADGILKDENKRDRVVTRWTGPVTIVVRGDAAKDFLPHVDLVAADLAEASGIEVRVEEARLNRGDIELMVTWRKRYWPFFVAPVDKDDTDFTCIALPVSREGRMLRSDIHINAGNIGEQVARACILEELLQSFGLFGEVEDLSTALNDLVGYERLGDADRILVRTLYDERLTPGLDAEEAMIVMEPILREYLYAPR